ncbi:hypothetical protein OKW98_18175 [Pseudomonas sp. KU26590]|uniref:hypothetical protein n=1 Tax=Pseudomonas sp. KU26590 TaxID=2991051 RepID=UPI00223D6E1F|nr:hypothetical protein [Pseudomonas sp. KU26590]UZJ58512.1 hypothetical protein OKW98_18175 [Pseudomonas sp. KU26590]
MQFADALYRPHPSDFKDWIVHTKRVTSSPKSLDWFQSNKVSVESKRVEYWPVWQKKSAADVELRTLHAADGL